MKKTFLLMTFMLIALMSFSQCLPSASYQPDSATHQLGIYYHTKSCKYYNTPGNEHIADLCYYDGNVRLPKRHFLGYLGVFRTMNDILPSFGAQASYKWVYIGFSSFKSTKNVLYKVLCEAQPSKFKSMMVMPIDKDVIITERTKKQQLKLGLNVPVVPSLYLIPIADIKYIETNGFGEFKFAPEFQFAYIFHRIGLNAGWTFDNSYTVGLFYSI